MRRQEKPLFSWWLSTRQTDGISVGLQRNFRDRLYPTKKQEGDLHRLVEIHRRLYDAGLQERKGAWERRGVSRNHYALATHLKAVREGDPAAAFANYTSLQQTLRRLEKAFTAFFRRVKAGEKPGYPRFRSRRRFTRSNTAGATGST